jgi:hypothetical protein|tara:strand:- start:404 stop:859 length:456 start_codon:yes stop_codon:yes gene_type:complete
VDPRAGRRLCGGAGQFFALSADGLLAYAAHQFYLAAPVGQGITREMALWQVAKATGRQMPAEPKLPGCLLHVWNWFLQLSPVYGDGGRLNPSHLAADIRALDGFPPTGREIGLLLRLFAAWRETAGQDLASINGTEKDGNGHGFIAPRRRS